MMTIKRVSVIGGGTMGNGIAHVFAQSGFQVHLVELDLQRLEKAIASIDKNLARMVTKEKITEEQKAQILARIHPFQNLTDAVSDADLVVEAVNEQFELKKTIFTSLDQSTPSHAILASNTSSISITKIAAVTSRPQQVIGMHFFNPVPMMKLVEVVRGLETSDAVYQTIHETAIALGKSPVPVNDFPGFVSNRVLMPMINEAIFAVYEGVASPEHIDEVMKLGMAHPMGPLRLADFIGLDICLDILQVLYEGFKDPKYRPCPLLVQMVSAGRLGDKTGRGFFTYS